MHPANYNWWIYVYGRWIQYFENAKIIEVGSLNVNGSIRTIFGPRAKEYVGVDWRKGKNVDVISLAHEIDLPAGSFDAVLSASMLEHDPCWRKSIPKMIDLLHPEGILCLSWGAAENLEHFKETAPDNKFHPLPAGRVLNNLKEKNLSIQEFKYEDQVHFNPPKKWGICCLVAFKNSTRLSPPLFIDQLGPKDQG